MARRHPTQPGPQARAARTRLCPPTWAGLVFLVSVGTMCTADVTAIDSGPAAPLQEAPVLELTHNPALPTVTTPVTIHASAVHQGRRLPTTILVDGTPVLSCAADVQCTYSRPFPIGTHSYGVTARRGDGLAFDTIRTFTVEGDTAPDYRQAGSPHSPHWRHMRTSTIDYRIHYQKEPQRSREYDWAAAHFDHVTGGDLNEYKRRNPTIRHFPYDKFWFTDIASAGALNGFLAANGYPEESAYLHYPAGAAVPQYTDDQGVTVPAHAASGLPLKVDRVAAFQFQNRPYWYYNLGDPGFQAFRKHRTEAIVSPNSQGFRSDGLMFDTNNLTAINRHVPARTLEYASRAEYRADFDSLLAEHRDWVPAGFVMLNLAQYFNRPQERVLAKLAGGIMAEFENGPYRDPHWTEVDELVESGVVVEFTTAIKANHKGNVRFGVTPGNYATIAERVLMWEYASYLMVVDPARMDAVFFEPYIGSWDAPMESVWLPAFEVDIGLATGSRTVVQRGKDPAGQSYEIFRRDFENGTVLVRPRGGRVPGARGNSDGWDFGEASAVTITLESGGTRFLLANGQVTAPVTAVTLRAGEAVILLN